MFTKIVVTSVGLFLVAGSFFLTGVRGALGRSTSIPVSKSHKVYFFVVGLVVFIKGLLMFFS
jgi:hypothetical protein